MNIFTDGARSRKRLSVAKKAVQLLKALGGNKKVGIRDGFLFKVTKEGKGWIKAPFGIYVALSDEKGIRQFTCDSVGSPALPYFDAVAKDRYILMPDPMPPITYTFGWPDATNIYAAIGGELDTQMLEADPSNYLHLPENQETYQWKSAQPACIPVGGELVAAFNCYTRTSDHWINSTQITHCYNNGANDRTNELDLPSITTCWAASSGLTPGYMPERRIPTYIEAGYFEYVSWKPGFLFVAGGWPLVFTHFASDIPAKTVTYTGMAANTLFPALTSGVIAKLHAAHITRKTSLETAELPPTRATVGLSNLRGVCALSTYPDSLPQELLLSFVDAENGHQVRLYDDLKTVLYGLVCGEMYWARSLWMLANYSITPNMRGAFTTVDTFPTTGGSGTAGAILAGDTWYITSGSMTVPQLATNRTIYALIPDPGQTVSNWYSVTAFDCTSPEAADSNRVVAQATLVSLFGWPDDSEFTLSERDTSTFSDADGVVYSWLRSCDPTATQNPWGAVYSGTRNGGFKFSYTLGGISRVSMTMPAEVLTDVTLRPRLTLMTNTTYCCLADRRDGTIQHIYIGSPFGAWTTIAMPDADLYSVRPVIAGDTDATVSFIGIGKVTGEAYDFYIFFKPPGAAWVRLSPIPVVVGDVVEWLAAWDVCLFGDDSAVSQMMSQKQHPTASYERRPDLR